MPGLMRSRVSSTVTARYCAWWWADRGSEKRAIQKEIDQELADMEAEQ